MTTKKINGLIVAIVALVVALVVWIYAFGGAAKIVALLKGSKQQTMITETTKTENQ